MDHSVRGPAPVQFDAARAQLTVFDVGVGGSGAEQDPHGFRHPVLLALRRHQGLDALAEPPHLEQVRQLRRPRRGHRQQREAPGQGQQVGGVGDHDVRRVGDPHLVVHDSPQLVRQRDLFGVQFGERRVEGVELHRPDRTLLVREPPQQFGRPARLVQERGHRGPYAERAQHLCVVEARRVGGVVQALQARVATGRAQAGRAAAVEHRVVPQPPRGVGPHRLRRAVGEQHPYRLGQSVAQRRAGQHRQGLRPGVVVDQVQVAYGDELGGDRRHRGVRELVQDVLAPHVDGVEQTGVVGLGEVAVAGLQFVRVQDDVGGPYEREGGQHPAGGQGLFAPAPGQLRFAQGEFALAHHLGEGAARQHEFTGGRLFPVLVGQGQRTQPGLVAGGQVRVAHEGEDGLGELVRVQGVLVPDLARVQRTGDGRADLRGRQDGPGGGGQRAQLLQQGVGGVGVGHLQTEPGQLVQDG